MSGSQTPRRLLLARCSALAFIFSSRALFLLQDSFSFSFFFNYFVVFVCHENYAVPSPIMSNSTSYKQRKEDFVSNLSGGPVSEINNVTAVALVRAFILLSSLFGFHFFLFGFRRLQLFLPVRQRTDSMHVCSQLRANLQPGGRGGRDELRATQTQETENNNTQGKHQPGKLTATAM